MSWIDIVGVMLFCLPIGLFLMALADYLTKEKVKQNAIRKIALCLIGIGCVGVGIVFTIGGLK